MLSASVYFSVGSPTRERSQAAFQKTAQFMLGQRTALQVRVWPRTAGRKRRASGTVAPPHAFQSPRRGRTWWKMHARTDPGLSRDTCKGWTSQPHSLLGWEASTPSSTQRHTVSPTWEEWWWLPDGVLQIYLINILSIWTFVNFTNNKRRIIPNTHGGHSLKKKKKEVGEVGKKSIPEFETWFSF